MENLKCHCCNYIPKTKYNYFRHLKSKKHLINSGEIDLESYLESEMFENEHKMNTNEHKMNTNEHNAHFCEYCFKTFKSKPSLVRHVKKFCKAKRNTTLKRNKTKKKLKL